MAETVLLHYSPARPLSCVLLNEKNAITRAPQIIELDELKNLLQGRKLIVLFDSAYLNIETVSIPGNNRQRQMQAVPFALEDKLASDIEDVHFALGKKQDDGNIPVVAIDKAVLDACLAFFKQADIVPEQIIADVLALPLDENAATVLLYEQASLIKISPANGLYCDRINLHSILKTLLEEHPHIKQLTIFHHRQEAEITDDFVDLGVEINSRSYNDHPLEILLAAYHDPQHINILQGAYAPQRKSSALWKHWKPAAALVAVWLVLQMATALVETRQLEEKNIQLRAQIEKAFKKANPGARKFNNMRKRVERRLKELQSGGGDGNNELFLQLLAETAPALSQQKKIKIKAMVYRNKHIDLEISADSLQTLEAVKSHLSSRPGIKIVLSTSIEKDNITGRLRVEKQG